MTSRRTLRILTALATILPFGDNCAAIEPIGPLLLSPETRTATTYECLRRDPKLFFFAEKTLEEFRRYRHPLHVLPVPAAGKPNGYIVTPGHGPLTFQVLPLSAGDDDIFGRGRLHLGRERALIPYPGNEGFYIKEDGTLAAPSAAAGFVADLNGDGVPEVVRTGEGTQVPLIALPAEASNLICDNLSIFTSEEEVIADIAFNPRTETGSLPEAWKWWAEDSKATGIFTIHLGPVTGERGESRVSIQWNAAERKWKAHGIDENTPCRFSNKSDAKEALQNACSQGKVRVPSESPVIEETPIGYRPTWARYPFPSPPPYKPHSLAGSTNDELFKSMTLWPRAEDYAEVDSVSRIKLPAASQTPPRDFAVALIEALQPPFLRATPIAFDTLDGKMPPDEGELMLDYLPDPGCFGPYVQKTLVLRCSPQGSSLSAANEFLGNSPYPMIERMHETEFRCAELPYEEAKHLLQTAWWVTRARRWPENSKAALELNLAGRLMGAPDIKVRLTSQRATLAKYNRMHDAEAEICEVIDWLIRAYLPAKLGPMWETQALPAFAKGSKPDGDALRAQQERLSGALRTYLETGAGPEACVTATRAIAEYGLTSLIPLLEQVEKAIPPATVAQVRKAALSMEIDQWVRKHGREKAGSFRHDQREARRKNEPPPGVIPVPALPDGALPAIDAPDPTLGLGIPKHPPITEEELAQFAPLDALYREQSSLTESELERVSEDLRIETRQALALLRGYGNVDALAKAASETRWDSDAAIRRLGEMDPIRAAEVLRAKLAQSTDPNPELYRESIAILLKRADTPDDSTESLAIGARPAREEDIKHLAECSPHGQPAFRHLGGTIKALVPPSDPKRYPWPALDEALQAFAKRHGEIWELSAAMIRRDLPVETGERFSAWSLLTFHHPERFSADYEKKLLGELARGASYAGAIARAAWLCDFRSLAPALETRATNRYQDLQGSASVDREHEVRWVLSLWREPDPKTRAMLLLSFAVGSEFHPEDTPEEWSRLKEQLQQCLSGLPREDIIAVADFLRWMKNEGKPTVQQALPILRATRTIDALRTLITY